MKLRYTEDFNRDEMMKYVRGELALEGKPFTQENLQKKMDDLYYEWLASRVNDVIHKDDGINDTFGILYTLREIPIKYCVIVEQWMESKPIHYEGEYFNFEEVYNYVIITKFNLSAYDEFHIVIESIYYFRKCNNKIKECSCLSKKSIEEYKKSLICQINRAIFID